MTEYECLSLRLQIESLSNQMMLLRIAQANREDLTAEFKEDLEMHFNRCESNIDQIQDAWMRAESERRDNRKSKIERY